MKVGQDQHEQGHQITINFGQLIFLCIYNGVLTGMVSVLVITKMIFLKCVAKDRTDEINI